MDLKSKIILISGPTASGKSKFAVKLAKNADILIHEATFTHENRDKAKEHFHSTQLQAMEIADKAKVQRLILTHFSQRIKDSELKEWHWNGQPCVVFNERQIL